MKRDFKLITNGTDNHLILIDLRNKNVTGKEAEELLHKVGLTVNKNMIPNDPEKPTITSGIRIGTAAVTSRGMKEEEMKKIATIIDLALRQKDMEKLKDYVLNLTKDFPLYN